MKKTYRLYYYLLLLGVIGIFSACQGDEIPIDDPQEQIKMPDWYYTGGKLGTTFFNTSNCFSQATPAVDKAGMAAQFTLGDQLAERSFTSNATGTRSGLGPVYVRTSCQHCHPNYSHGMSVAEGTYDMRNPGNGTLIVAYNPATNGYVNWLAGMPQLGAVAPFKAPLDPNKITVHWLTATDDWSNTFPDGETYELRYPEVNFPKEAVYVYNQGFRDDDNLLETEGYVVVLENTIGIYGTGLLDAIPDDSLIAQYAKEYAAGVNLNPAYYNGEYINWYKNTRQGDGTPYVKKYTYALTRGPVLDGAGANAIWNITNVTRSDRRYHYLDLKGDIYATYASKDPEVQAGFEEYILKVDPDKEHADWWTDDMEANIYNYLMSTDLPVEMTDDEYTEVMIWHRGLAVPAARNATDSVFLRGKDLFTQMGCAYCHRPSWTTGNDDVQDPNLFFKSPNTQMPRYPHQTIWPYTDMIQHRLYMANDIRTGWCRTTPLWGRGLHRKATGDASEARLHDTRARDVIEAIMWHGYSQESDARFSVEQFRQLPKEDRDAMVFFINSI